MGWYRDNPDTRLNWSLCWSHYKSHTKRYGFISTLRLIVRAAEIFWWLTYEEDRTKDDPNRFFPSFYSIDAVLRTSDCTVWRAKQPEYKPNEK